MKQVSIKPVGYSYTIYECVNYPNLHLQFCNTV